MDAWVALATFCVVYLVGFLVCSYLMASWSPDTWGNDMQQIAAWLWPLGLLCLVHSHLAEAGRRAMARRLDAMAEINPKRGRLTRGWDDGREWFEYKDEARGLLVRWRDMDRRGW